MDKTLEEIISECNFKERIVIRTFKNLFEKVYHFTRVKTINEFL